jgi:hypothetical protein
MKYIVYQTKNIINGKIYIGVHQTENPEIFDGYLGCGAYINKPSSYNNTNYHLHNAILKYGVSNFERSILKIFDTPEEAFKLESELVTDEFVKRTDTYNMTVGGYIPPLHNKIIYQFDTNGNLIKEWKSIINITTYFKCNKDRINMCIKDKRSFKNSYWSENKKIDIKQYRMSSREIVFQYNSNGILLNSFANATEASQSLNIDRKTIIGSICDKHKCFGYYFLHSDDNINNIISDINKRKLNNQVIVYRYLVSGKFDREYESLSEAARQNKTSTGNIIRAIKNNSNCAGYKWSYIKNNVIL